MINLAYDNVDGFVTKHQKRGINVRWDGWQMVFFRPDRRAYRNKRGVFNRDTGEWGYEVRISPTDKGTWLVNPSLTQGHKVAGRR